MLAQEVYDTAERGTLTSSAVFLFEHGDMDLKRLRRAVVKDETGRLWKGKVKVNQS